MNDLQRARLQVACDLVSKRLREQLPADAIIAELVEKHHARFTTRYDGNKLTVAGVAASCTWSADKGLLDNWRKTATTRLMASA